MADIQGEKGSCGILQHSVYDRRRFLKTGIVAVAGLFFPLVPQIGFCALSNEARDLRFYNTHTDERLDVCYWANGSYLNGELASINHFFRDFRTGDVKVIDPRLLDLLHAISQKAGPKASLHLISGYRSPKTNQKLRQNSSGVARKSMHMLGHAADIRIPGVETATLRKIAVKIGGGGVGYYPKSDFVHVDIGRVRYW